MLLLSRVDVGIGWRRCVCVCAGADGYVLAVCLMMQAVGVRAQLFRSVNLPGRRDEAGAAARAEEALPQGDGRWRQRQRVQWQE